MLQALKAEPLRNQVMLLLAYDGALRREELVTLEISHFDFAYRQVRICAEHAKNGRERIVGYSAITGRFLEASLHQRRTLSAQPGRLFFSTSHRNPAHPLSPTMWSNIVVRLPNATNPP